jgi:hypothetical protein
MRKAVITITALVALAVGTMAVQSTASNDLPISRSSVASYDIPISYSTQVASNDLPISSISNDETNV